LKAMLMDLSFRFF